jgi:hypothetical protein
MQRFIDKVVLITGAAEGMYSNNHYKMNLAGQCFT